MIYSVSKFQSTTSVAVISQAAAQATTSTPSSAPLPISPTAPATTSQVAPPATSKSFAAQLANSDAGNSSSASPTTSTPPDGADANTSAPVSTSAPAPIAIAAPAGPSDPSSASTSAPEPSSAPTPLVSDQGEADAPTPQRSALPTPSQSTQSAVQQSAAPAIGSTPNQGETQDTSGSALQISTNVAAPAKATSAPANTSNAVDASRAAAIATMDALRIDAVAGNAKSVADLIRSSESGLQKISADATANKTRNAHGAQDAPDAAKQILDSYFPATKAAAASTVVMQSAA